MPTNAITLTKKQEFIDAIGVGKLGKVKRLVEEEGMSPNNMVNKYVTPLMLAASYGHSNLVKYLIKAGANPGFKTRSGMTALFHSIEGKTYNEDYEDPPRPESVKLLLADSRTDPNALWNTGRGGRVSPLGWAVIKAEVSEAAGKPSWFADRLAVVQLLLEHPGLDEAERLNIKTKVAALENNYELKKLFGLPGRWWFF